MRRMRWAWLLFAAAFSTACGGRNAVDVRGSDGGGMAAGSSGASSSSGCAPEAFNTDGSGGIHLALDATHAYFTTAEERIVRARLGGGPEEILVDSRFGLVEIALFGDFVYFSDNAVIARVPKAGGAVEELTPLDHGAASAIAVDETGVYWMASDGGLFGTNVERLSPDGQRTTLAGQIDVGQGMSLAGDRVLFAATSLLSPSSAQSVVAFVPKAGGTITVLAQDLPGPKLPFAYGDHVYWVEALDETLMGHGSIARAPKDGGVREKVITLDGATPFAGSTDGKRFYLTAILDVGGPTALFAASFPDGGQVKLMAESARFEFFSEVAVNEDRVAWSIQKTWNAPEQPSSVRVLCKDE